MGKRRKYDVMTLTSTCAWCKKRIPEGSEIFAVSATVLVGSDLSPYEGDGLPLRLLKSRKTVVAIVPTADSEARQEGKDLVFAACSVSCAQEMRQALQQELDMVDHVF